MMKRLIIVDSRITSRMWAYLRSGLCLLFILTAPLHAHYQILATPASSAASSAISSGVGSDHHQGHEHSVHIGLVSECERESPDHCHVAMALINRLHILEVDQRAATAFIYHSKSAIDLIYLIDEPPTARSAT